MSIGSQQEIGAARRVSQKQLQICSQEDSAAEEEARAQRRNNRGATYISATHEGGQRGLSHAKQQEAMNGTNTKPSSQGSLIIFIEHVVLWFVCLFFKESRCYLDSSKGWSGWVKGGVLKTRRVNLHTGSSIFILRFIRMELGTVFSINWSSDWERNKKTNIQTKKRTCVFKNIIFEPRDTPRNW